MWSSQPLAEIAEVLLSVLRHHDVSSVGYFMRAWWLAL
jgi:hypothetical protein